MFKTFQQEIEMFEKAQLDSRIYGIFLSNYFDLVLRMAMKFSSQDDTDDLFQEGCIGLMKAFHRFDPTKGYRFKTYAVWWIRDSIVEYLWRGNLVKITREMALSGRKPKKICSEDFDLEQLVFKDSKYNAFNIMVTEDRKKLIESVLFKLDPLKQKVIELRFGLKDNEYRSFQQVGNLLGYSKQRVHQLYKQALAELTYLVEEKEVSKDLFL